MKNYKSMELIAVQVNEPQTWKCQCQECNCHNQACVKMVFQEDERTRVLLWTCNSCSTFYRS